MARAGNQPVYVALFQHHRAEIRAVFQQFFRLIGRHTLGSAQFAKARIITGQIGRSKRINDRNARQIHIGIRLFDFVLVAEKHDFRHTLFRSVGSRFHHAGIFAFAKNDRLVKGFCFFFDFVKYVFHFSIISRKRFIFFIFSWIIFSRAKYSREEIAGTGNTPETSF